MTGIIGAMLGQTDEPIHTAWPLDDPLFAGDGQAGTGEQPAPSPADAGPQPIPVYPGDGLLGVAQRIPASHPFWSGGELTLTPAPQPAMQAMGYPSGQQAGAGDAPGYDSSTTYVTGDGSGQASPGGQADSPPYDSSTTYVTGKQQEDSGQENISRIAPGGKYDVFNIDKYPTDPKLHPAAANALTEAFAEMNAQGITPGITKGFRTAAEQQDILAHPKPNSRPAAKVSWHQAGMAVDLNSKDTKNLPAIVQIMHKHGFVWGGEFKDDVHFQFVPAGTVPTASMLRSVGGGQ